MEMEYLKAQLWTYTVGGLQMAVGWLGGWLGAWWSFLAGGINGGRNKEVLSTRSASRRGGVLLDEEMLSRRGGVVVGEEMMTQLRDMLEPSQP
jgi:hypothetical protein